jgi:hypothetical protein
VYACGNWEECLRGIRGASQVGKPFYWFLLIEKVGLHETEHSWLQIRWPRNSGPISMPRDKEEIHG